MNRMELGWSCRDFLSGSRMDLVSSQAHKTPFTFTTAKLFSQSRYKWHLQQKNHNRMYSRATIYFPFQTKFVGINTVVCCTAQRNPKINTQEEGFKAENVSTKEFLLKCVIIPVATSLAVFSLAIGARVAGASTFNRRLNVPLFANVSASSSVASSTTGDNTSVPKPENGTKSFSEENPIAKDSGPNAIDGEIPVTHEDEIQDNGHNGIDGAQQEAESISGQEVGSIAGNQIGEMSEQLESAEDSELQKAYEKWMSKPYALTVPLRIAALRGSVPPVWIKDFLRAQGRRLKLQIELQGSLGGIISQLGSSLEKRHVTPKSIVVADLVTVGDSWLELAIRDGLIEPIKNAEQQDWFNRLSDRWKAYLRRDQNGHLNPRGEIWGVPYRWGCMVVAYRKDKFEKYNIPPIKDWEDLWRPELTGKISMVDSPREVVGAILKCLEASYNAKSFESDIVDGRNSASVLFLLLQRQVRLFDSVHYLKAFGSGDVWVTVGWSSDVISATKGIANVAIVVPKSGSSLWADLWAIPAASKINSDKVGGRIRGPSPLIHQWFDFCLQPARAIPFEQNVFSGASPLYLSDNTVDIKHEADPKLNEPTNGMQASHLKKVGPKFDTNLVEGVPPVDILQKCEFLEPLSEEARLDYEWLLAKTEKAKGWPNSFWQYLKGIRETLKLTPLRGDR